MRERILPEARAAPIEGERKVLVLFEAERLRGNQNESANAMLKTLEEPPDRTVVVLVTGAPDDLLPTIRSRCQRIDFDPIADDDVRAALERDGVARVRGGDARRARGRSARAGARARRTLGRLRRRVRGGARARRRLRRDRARASREELDAAVDEAAAAVDRQQREELAAFDAEMERLGYAEREAQRMRRRIEDRHKRETRRTRIDLLTEGVTAIESVYRDALGGARAAAERRPARAAGHRRVPPRPRSTRAARRGGVPDQREGCRPSRCAADGAPVPPGSA